jgi:L-lactate dehydrogenase complex protein LldE
MPVLALKDAEVMVIASGSCGAMLKYFTVSFAQLGTLWRPAIFKKCYEFSDFLVSKLGITDLGARFPAKSPFTTAVKTRELGNKRPARVLIKCATWN